MPRGEEDRLDSTTMSSSCRPGGLSGDGLHRLGQELPAPAAKHPSRPRRPRGQASDPGSLHLHTAHITLFTAIIAQDRCTVKWLPTSCRAFAKLSSYEKLGQEVRA